MSTKTINFVTNECVYISMLFCMIGQCIIGTHYFCGQSAYLIANVISLVRCFIIERPASDKIKDFTFTIITLALILFYVFNR